MLNSSAGTSFRAGTSRYGAWLLIALLVGIIGGIKILWWWGGQPSPRPKMMPQNSVWIDAPSLPFSWHHGWWFGCWIDSDGHSDRCRLWNAPLESPVYEGQYVSCETHSPVAANHLILKAPSDSAQMWVRVASADLLAPAAFLQNGNFLVPVDAPRGCE